MRDELLLYYERELRFIRKAAMDFAEKYPDQASRLLLEPTKCEDPHVERLIEAFAMLTARVQLRLDDDFAELSHALLEILYPHYLRPIPSSTIVQLSLDPEQGAPAEGLEVARHSLLRSRSIEGVRCAFRTCYDTRLWPLEVESVELQPVTGSRAGLPPDARSVMRIRLKAQGGLALADFAIPSLRFFLSDQGESLQTLYEMFLREGVALGVQWGAGGEMAVVGGADRIRPVGFGPDEGLLEYPLESFRGYRLLQEYFSFPDKFLFVDLCGLDEAPRDPEAPQEYLELSVFLKRSMATIDVRFTPENLQLGCVPAVNLFPHRPDPIRLTQHAVEYPVVPDARSPFAYEVYAIEDLSVTSSGSQEARAYAPFYGIRHQASAGAPAYWHATRRESIRKNDAGTDVFVSLVDPDFHPTEAASGVVHIEALCSNRDLPARLPFGDPTGDFQLEGRPEVSKIVCLRKPTAPLRAPMQYDARWRIVSHLALNHLSLTGEGGEASAVLDAEGATPALAALREILRVYDFTDSPAMRQRIAGLVGLRSRKVLRRTDDGVTTAFARGLEVQLEFDETQYAGTGALLFAMVLERFLGLYASINSFVQTVAISRQREEPLKRWAPRAGEIRLL